MVDVKAQKSFELTDDMIEAAKSAAPIGVISKLSEYDQLLGFLTRIPSLTQTEAVRAYFSGGNEDAQGVVSLLKQLGLLGSGKKILEFAAGYGRVTRHLKPLLSENGFSTSDIHPTACQEHSAFEVPCYVSSTYPEDLTVPGEQDFIFALSLFSHLPLETQGRWLKCLYALLAPGGYLMFTTHGATAMRIQPEFFGQDFDPSIGFGYRVESDQLDLSSADYGTAVVTMPFVSNLVDEFTPDAELVSFRAATWFALQDEWLVRKPAATP